MQDHPDVQFKNFTDRAKQTLAHARTRALQMGQPQIGTEHILLGILDEGTGVAFNVLKNCGQDTDDLCNFTMHCARRDPAIESGESLPFTDYANMLLECAHTESQGLGQSYVGTEFLLLGMLRETSGMGGKVLRERGLVLDDVRSEVRAFIGG